MSVTTNRSITITPIEIRTTATLQQMQGEMSRTQYPRQIPSFGWGSLDDNDSVLGRLGAARPTPGRAVVVHTDDDGRLPQLRARYYWDEPDRRLAAIPNLDLQAQDKHSLSAVDVFICATGTDDLYLGLISSRDMSVLRRYALPGINRMLRAIDPSAAMRLETSPLDFGDDDVFKWLLHVYSTPAQTISGSMRLTMIRAVTGHDRLSRGANLTQAADLDRADLLALLSSSGTKFGPLKLTVYDDAKKMTADFELAESGAFSVYMTNSGYNEQASRAEIGMRFIEDLAFDVIPGIAYAHNSDSAWLTGGARDEFMSSARTRLIDAVSRAQRA